MMHIHEIDTESLLWILKCSRDSLSRTLNPRVRSRGRLKARRKIGGFSWRKRERQIRDEIRAIEGELRKRGVDPEKAISRRFPAEK